MCVYIHMLPSCYWYPTGMMHASHIFCIGLCVSWGDSKTVIKRQQDQSEDLLWRPRPDKPWRITPKREIVMKNVAKQWFLSLYMRESLKVWHAESLENEIRKKHDRIEAVANNSGWWFGTFSIFPYIGNNHPNWLIFFRGVQTTNQNYTGVLYHLIFFQGNSKVTPW